MEGFWHYRPYVDPEFESLIERLNPPRVSIDNDACKDCTLIMVDSANKNGILLEVVQILTDLDLVISKSYICSDGGWFMDVFHVTDRFGNKITDDTSIQQAICMKQIPPQGHLSPKHTVVEMTMRDQPGVLSELSSVLVELGCQVMGAVAWTHNHRAACIFYVDDKDTCGPITDRSRRSNIQDRLQIVLEAQHKDGEKWSVKLAASPTTGETHIERRLHQLMMADEDYNGRTSCGVHVSIESCKEKGYSVVYITCGDRPKLLFDTVCALTDMGCIVFHAAISSNCSVAVQEYYVRHQDGCTLDTQSERQKVIQCLIAAIERRDTQGLRLDITAKDSLALLSDLTRVFKVHGLSISRADISTKGNKTAGTFYITNTLGNQISRETIEAVKREIGGSIQAYEYDGSPVNNLSSSSIVSSKRTSGSSEIGDRPVLLSLGSLLWSRLSSNFRSIRL